MLSESYWRLIDTGSGFASGNMAIDEAILDNCKRGYSPPVLHFYTWREPAITLGYLQDLNQTVQVEKCMARGIEVVRRITGGKAVVHHKDLGFSLIFPAKSKIIPPGIGSSYLKIAQGLVRGLKLFGIEAYLTDGRLPDNFSSYARKDISACFLTRIRYEILFSGRKLAGFAQRRIGEWVLQQGTLMLDLDRRLWADLLYYPEQLIPGQFMERLGAEMTSIREISKKDIETDSIKRALLKGLSMNLGVEFKANTLFPDEEAEKERFARGKYKDLLGGTV